MDLRVRAAGIFFATCILTAVCHGQSRLGVGLVSIDFNDKTVIEFFNAAGDRDPARRVEFFDDKSINSWNIRDLKNQSWLAPEVLWLEYSPLVFRCQAQTDKWFQVTVNNKTGQTYWLRKSEAITLKTWEQFLKGMFGVARLGSRKQVIRSLPVRTARVVNYAGRDCFQVRSMKDDWIEIFSADYCKAGDNPAPVKLKSGWIRWRTSDRLLIDYHITS